MIGAYNIHAKKPCGLREPHFKVAWPLRGVILARNTADFGFFSRGALPFLVGIPCAKLGLFFEVVSRGFFWGDIKWVLSLRSTVDFDFY